MVSPHSKRNGNYSAIARQGGPEETGRGGDANSYGNRQKFEKKYAPSSSSKHKPKGSSSGSDESKRLAKLETQVRQALASFRGDSNKPSLPAVSAITKFIAHIEDANRSDIDVDVTEFRKCLFALGVTPDDTAFLLDKLDQKSSGLIDAKMLSKHFLPNNYGVSNGDSRNKLVLGKLATQAAPSAAPISSSEKRAMKELHRKVIERVLVKSKTQNIKDAFHQYDTDRKGYLTLPQFRTFVRDHGFAGTEVERLIKYLDRDSQGTISFNVFSGDVKLGANQAYPKSPPKKQQLVQPLEKHDGTPSKNKTTEEHQDPMESIRAKLRQRVIGHNKSIREVFMDFDNDGNGYLDYEEFKRFMAKYNFTQDEACQAIEYLDRDFSGTIDYDEFASGLLFFRPLVAPAPSAPVSSISHQAHNSSSKLSTVKADRALQLVQQKLADKIQDAYSTKSARKRLRDDFIKYDAENKNGLDYQEFGAFLVGMGIKLKAEELSALLATIDTDSSEIIEFEKIAKLYQASLEGEDDEGDTAHGSDVGRLDKDERLLAVFNKYDIGGSGFLNYEESAQLMRDYGFSEPDILHVLKQIDQDGAASGRHRNGRNDRSKGKVNYKTFLSVVQKRKWNIHDSPAKSQSLNASSAANQHTLWVTRVLQKHLSLEEAFRGHDTDGSGELDYNEFRRFMKHYGMRNDRDINALIDQMDGDGNETISLDEFMQVFGRARGKGGKQKQQQSKQDTKMRLASLRERETLWIQDVLRDYNSIQEAFREFDRHGRNELNYQQFRGFMEQYGISSEEDISLLIKRLDADNSGTIDLQEFLSVFNEQRLAHQKNAVTRTKKERPAPSATLLQKRERVLQLHKAEEMWIQRATEMHGSVKVAFEKFDLDQSGELDYDEFRHLMAAFGISDREHIETLKKRLDVDSSGTIDFEEFATIFYEERVEKYKDSVQAQSKRTSTKQPAKTATEDKKARLARQRELEVKWMKRVLSCHQSIESAFNEYDENGSCELDHDEFRRFMTRYGIVREDDISSLIKRLDLDGSGTIDFEEFSSVFNPLRLNQGGQGKGLTGMFPGLDEELFDTEELESILEIERELALRMLEKTRDLRSAFRKYDLNGNGRLEYKEFRQVLRAYRFPEAEIRKVIRHLDKDVSGFIDYKEFIAGFTITKENERGSPGGTRRNTKYQVASVQKPGAAAAKSKRLTNLPTSNGGSSSGMIERLKKDLLSKILATYGTVQSVFRQYDDKQQGRLTEYQFEALVADHGMTRSDARVLLDAFDQDHSGTIEYEEFLAQLVVRSSM